MNNIALKIDYFVFGTGDNGYYGEIPLIEFKDNLQSEYICTFNLKYAELGGGNFIIEFLYSISLKDYLMIVLGGAAWDVIKTGAKEFILRPFIEMYEEFKKKDDSQKIQDVKFVFSDSTIYITIIKDIEYEINFKTIGKIFKMLAKQYTNFKNEYGANPTEIHLPLFFDPVTLEKPVYRYKLDVDEPLYFHEGLANQFKLDSYFKTWGLEYMDYSRSVYLVADQKMIRTNWMLKDEYLRVTD